MEAGTELRVRRLTLAVDVGRVVNPDGVRNQIEGGAVQATSWTLKERVRFDRTRITSTDWESYPILRFSETPAVDVVLLDRPDQPSLGSGEASQGPTAAAIGNAVADALGVRVRDLPITAERVVSAIDAKEPDERGTRVQRRRDRRAAAGRSTSSPRSTTSTPSSPTAPTGSAAPSRG